MLSEHFSIKLKKKEVEENPTLNLHFYVAYPLYPCMRHHT